MDRVIDTFEITRIQLEGIRGFHHIDLSLKRADGSARKRTLIIGRNGTGKSTLLRAIAIGLADQPDASRLVTEPIGGLITYGRSKGTIYLDLVEPGTAATGIRAQKEISRTSNDKEIISTSYENGERKWSPGDVAIEPLAFVCAYGAGRFGPGPEVFRGYRLADSVSTLFRYEQTLIDPELTLRRLYSDFPKSVYERTLRGIKRALGLTEADEIKARPGGGIVISGPTVGNDPVPLEGWADGYRLTFSWILDLYAWAMRAERIDEEGNVEGVLLIDEIDQHLHPFMQAEILPRLSDLFPKMQIFATTHSPLVALDARPDELVVLRRSADGIFAEKNVPDFTGYSVEDIIADPRLFGTEVYGEEMMDKLTEYRELASVPKETRTSDQRQKLREIANEIQSLGHYSEEVNETSRLLKEFLSKYGV